jgi:uncharacterized damage-inducible protein DinB
MRTADLLIEAFDRIHGLVHAVVDGLTPDQLAQRPAPDANSIGWLVWHLTRVQDDHVAEVAQAAQVWDEAWVERFGLPFETSEIGYGHTSEQVGEVRPASPDLLTEYHDAVAEQTRRYLGGLTDADLDRVVDRRWDPPVTLGARLVSVISDDLQHAGQAAYVRGLICG